MIRKFVSTLLCVCVATIAFAANNSKTSWAPAGDGLKTKWAADVDPTCPLKEYPRPQMVRQEWQNLNGLWSYAVTARDAEYKAADGQILVPFCIESSLSGVQKRVSCEEALWYERTFIVPKAWKGRKVLLHFGAVDWKSEVWVNGQMVGMHTGGYTPFTFDITSALAKSGKQTLRVRVEDNTDNGYQPRGKQVLEPHGVWYTPVTGIWQTVWMEPVAAQASIDSYYPVWNAESKTLDVEVKASGDYDSAKIELFDGDALIAEGASMQIAQPKLWSHDSPFMYSLKVSLLKNGKVVDSVDGYACLRSVSVAEDPKPDRNTNSYKRLGVNGDRTFMFGPLDQGWWPDGLYTAPTDEALRYDIQKVKDFGWNMIRKHIKVEPARWYYWCDVMGIYVWQDMPCIGDHDKNRGGRSADVVKNTGTAWSRDSMLGGEDCIIPQEWKDNYYKEWSEIISSLKSFQCIVVWIPFNEQWGQFDTPEVVAFTKKADPTRLVNEASGGNFALVGDILDVHHYASPAMNVFESKFINVIGEYGGLGLPIAGHLWQEKDVWGYGKTFESAASVMAVYSKFGDMLKTFIQTGCAAAVYTQITDVEIEVNGIMTYDRMVKLDEGQLKAVNEGVIASLEK